MDIIGIVILLGFLIVFPLFWCAVVFLISRFAWAGYGEEFATDRGKPADGESASFQAIHFGAWYFGPAYNNVVTIAASERGLFLAPSLFLFRPGHRDLLIPWSKIDHVVPGSFLWVKTNRIEVRGGYRTISIYRAISHAVRERWEAETGRKRGS